jgi:hypothetical protein
MGDGRRLYFLDNLKIALTILVIAHHVGKLMAENQYAAYLFHVPVVVLVQVAVVNAAISPFVKFALVTALSVPLTFLLSAAVRTPAIVRKVL